MLSSSIFQDHTKAISFAIIGAIGFVIDATLLTLLLKANLSVVVARFFSFSTATLVTWLLNRSFTFKVKAGKTVFKSIEYAKYISVQIMGALLNLFIFLYVIWLHPGLINIPVIPLSIGAIFGMLFNYLGSHYWVYK